MLTPITSPLSVSLGSGLTLRTLTSVADAERIANFIAAVFDPNVGAFMHTLLIDHPDIEPADQFYVETAEGEIVSSLCLVPWRWAYGPVMLHVGEMAMVATAPRYRNRGLVRAQVVYFRQRLIERGCVLSSIQGIPYFYRQFGYEYALPLEGGWQVGIYQLPAHLDSTYNTLRLATHSDLSTLITLYEEARRPLTIYTHRTPAIWEYLLAPPTMPDAGKYQTWVICTGTSEIGGQAKDEVVGYVRLSNSLSSNELVVYEASRMTLNVAIAILAHLRQRAIVADQPVIRLCLPMSHDLVQLGRSLGAHEQGTYAWQIHVPSISVLLRALAPALNARLADSLFARFTQEVHMGLYRKEIILRFVAGKLVEVSELPHSTQADFSLPPMTLAPLLLGYRSLEEICAHFPDVSVHGQWRLLLETLFPRVPAFLYPGY